MTRRIARHFILAASVAVAAAAALSPPAAASGQQRPPTFVDLPYPKEALGTRAAGTVIAQVTTDATGQVTETKALSGAATLTSAVVANVRQWKLASGQRTDFVVYRFEIDHGACNDDSRSLFRMKYLNLAVITACTAASRSYVTRLPDALPIASYGETPAYSQLGRNAGITGIVVLELTFDAAGAVTASRALNSLPLLDDAAAAHSKSWRIDTTTPGRGLVVYESVLDNRDCTPETRTTFQSLGSDYVRLSGCEPTINVD